MFVSCSVMSDSLRSCELYLARLLCPWDFPGKNTKVGCHFLLQGIFPTQGSNPRLLNVLRWQTGSLPLVPPGEALIQVHHLQRKSTRKKGKEASGTRTPHGPSWGNRCFLRIFLLLLKTQFFRAEGLWLTIRFSSVQSLSRVQLFATP